MGSSPEDRQRLRETRRQRIKRSEWRQIYWPMIGAFVVIVALAIVLFAMPGTAGDMLVVFLLLLCPTAVILYAVYVSLVLLAIGLGKGDDYGYKGLEKLNDLAEQMRGLTKSAALVVNEQSIRFNAALAPATQAMSAVVEPERRDGAAKMKTGEANDSNTAE
ncbi:MAG: hypothetical protein JNL34_07195 [Anaerolineae bacterium]|nr:hypothetical protein [Anaerolineae bacterium]